MNYQKNSVMLAKGEISSSRFAFKVSVMLLISLTCIYVISSDHFLLLTILGQFVLGCMFAHGIELLHECIHDTAISNKKINDGLGTLLGLPMLVSYHHYKRDHLQHHKVLGRPGNTGFFKYPFDQNPSIVNLVSSMFNFARYRCVLSYVVRSFFKAPVEHIPNNYIKKIRREYLLMGVLIFSALGLMVFGFFWPISIWLAPLLLFAEPMHFLIEVPEHILCNEDSTNVALNSRSITGSAFSRWFTNGNNFHAEHHAYPNISFAKLAEIHAKELSKLRHYSKTYPGFFRQLVKETYLVTRQDTSEVKL